MTSSTDLKGGPWEIQGSFIIFENICIIRSQCNKKNSNIVAICYESKYHISRQENLIFLPIFFEIFSKMFVVIAFSQPCSWSQFHRVGRELVTCLFLGI